MSSISEQALRLQQLEMFERLLHLVGNLDDEKHFLGNIETAIQFAQHLTYDDMAVPMRGFDAYVRFLVKSHLSQTYAAPELKEQKQ